MLLERILNLLFRRKTYCFTHRLCADDSPLLYYESSTEGTQFSHPTIVHLNDDVGLPVQL